MGRSLVVLLVLVAAAAVPTAGPGSSAAGATTTSETIFDPPVDRSPSLRDVDVSRSGRWVAGRFEGWNENDLVDTLVAVDLDSGEQRIVAEFPFGEIRNLVGVSDTGLVVTGIAPNLATYDVVTGTREALQPGTTIDLRTGGVVTTDAASYRSATRPGVVVADGRFLVDGEPVEWTRPGLDPDLASESPFVAQYLADDGSRALGITSRLLLEGPYDLNLVDVAPTGSWTDVGELPVRTTPGVWPATVTFRAASADLDRIVYEDVASGTLHVHDITADVVQSIPGISSRAWLSGDGTTLVHDSAAGLAVTRLDAPTPIADRTPAAVRFLNASAGDDRVALSWTAPLGIVPIDRYVVTLEPGGRRLTTTGTSLLVEGLENLTTYTFTVAAESAAGIGPTSAAMATPAGRPDPVENLEWSYDGGTSRMTFTWDPPAPNDESPAIGFGVVLPSGGSFTSGLNLRSYTVEVERGDSFELGVFAIGGTSLRGPVSSVVGYAGEVPGIPEVVVLEGLSSGSVSVRWQPPLDDGGFPVTRYDVWVDGRYQAVDGSGRSATFSGFEPGDTVDVSVRARNVVGAAAAVSGSVVVPEPTPQPTPTPEPTPTPAPVPVPLAEPGYWMVERAGDLYGFGAAGPFEAVSSAEIVSLATDVDGDGLWVLDAAGVVHVRGDAVHHGDVDLGVLDPGERVATIAVRPAGDGYWVFTDRGRALAFGAAVFHGDMTDFVLNGEIVASAATSDGGGYWMVGSDGGIFSFGNAVFAGSTGSLTLNAPVVGIAPDPDGEGYWLVAADGGIFAFDSEFRGSVPGVLPAGASLNAPVIGALAFGDGYLMVASDGGIFNFSDLAFLGSLGGQPLDTPIVGVAAFTS